MRRSPMATGLGGSPPAMASYDERLGWVASCGDEESSMFSTWPQGI
jgi:hypothetical protein